ncbi:hypothetical protein CROQUDRAFT_654948 [Cronartium quercuum f. sp. fusiforme G11]|uniref:Nudix hydrolase domain-containing protein n=1 Tax=Cronartium quercuum f. sp. fusiforme G11 TaxID=708437 RepID=A0A9P6NLX5_9BASI|nr:hypothetical protein CROQUDRAFT_654948 [Cronartium quercuum f. sp. fusiforme G11]
MTNGDRHVSSLSGKAEVGPAGKHLDEEREPGGANGRLSASLILIKPVEKFTSTNDGFNYRTLLVERNSVKGSFLSAHVFPGGNIDEDDYTVSKMIDHDCSDMVLSALKSCAIRENFEETGILVGTNMIDDSKPISSDRELLALTLSEWRQKILNRSELFSNFLKFLHSNFGREVKLNSLLYYGNYHTPMIFPKRWDTHFFMSIVPEDHSTDNKESGVIGLNQAIVDGAETVSMSWLTPREAISLATSAIDLPPIKLAPPQFYFLSELCMKSDYDSIIKPTTYLKSKDIKDIGFIRKVIKFIPEICKTKFNQSNHNELVQLVLPGDPQHSSTDSLIHSSTINKDLLKHRVYIRPQLQPKIGFLNPMGVERIGMLQVLGQGWDDMVVGQMKSF